MTLTRKTPSPPKRRQILFRLAGLLLLLVLPAPPLGAQPPPTSTETTALATRQGNLSELVLLQQNGQNLHQSDSAGNTLLHVAAAFGQLPAAAWLVEQGLDPLQPNKAGLTPADLAEAKGHALVVAVLRNKGVRLIRPSTSPSTDTSLPALTYHPWTSMTGDVIEAAFISLQQDQVILKSRDDHQIVIPMHRLQWRDQIMARRLAGQPGTTPLSAGQPSAIQGRRECNARVVAAFGPACEALLTAAIDDARHEILVAIFTLTSTTISDALRAAAHRGVRIQIKYDGGQIEVGRMAEIMATLDTEPNITTCPVEMRGRFASMHHKFAVIDQAFVFTGSFNFTVTAATQSYENAVLMQSDAVAADYTREFEAVDGLSP